MKAKKGKTSPIKKQPALPREPKYVGNEVGFASRSFKRRLGQNFLRDPKILRKIADFAQIKEGDTVLEIGPGEGALTKILLEAGGRVLAVEKDNRLAAILNERFKKEILHRKLILINEDVIKKEFSPAIRDKSYKLVGNIPYYITGAIFKKFLESSPSGIRPESITFVVQKEVAERILARDDKESILSISIKAYGTPEYGGVIKAGSFYPAPKVDSAIISIRNISGEKFEKYGLKESDLFSFLHAGFAHKRKFLISNLSRMPMAPLGKLDTKKLREVFEKCRVGEKARAEDLSLEKWFCLAKNILISQ
jgi:16S rRNA (adenine1518-N6/adenine1519-N6)-dimethyltransferase